MKLPVNIKTNTDNNSKRVPCPEGVHSGVCVDVEDMGWVNSQYGWKGYIKVYFEAMVEDEDGYPRMLLHCCEYSCNNWTTRNWMNKY